MSDPLVICEKDPKARLALQTALQAYGPPYSGIEVREETGISFEKPLRLGVVLDAIRKYIAQPASVAPLAVGPYVLDRASATLIADKSKPIRLTEKEVHILSLLHGAQGAAVDRRTLLEKVWDYAENVETHTLETHIYRLRQKIEKDAGVPEILLTEGGAYRLKI